MFVIKEGLCAHPVFRGISQDWSI